MSRKNKFLIALAIYFFGFIVLSMIGEKLNDNGYHYLGFFAPLFILIGMAGMVWSLIYTNKH